MRETLAQFQDLDILETLGLRFSTKGLSSLHADHPEVQWNDELADLFGRFSMCLIGHRLQRGLPMLEGYPRKCVLATDPALCDGFWATMKGDLENFQKLTLTGKHMKKMATRSKFNSVAVEQYIRIFTDCGWRSTPRLRAWLTQKHSRINTTQLCEDGFCREHIAEQSGRNALMACDRTLAPVVVLVSAVGCWWIRDRFG